MGTAYKILENALFPLDGSEDITDANGNTLHGIAIMGKNPSGKIVVAELDESGNLKSTAEISGDVNVDQNSVDTSGYVGKPAGANGDFTTAYVAATQFSCSGLPTGVTALYNADIVAILQISVAGTVVNTYTRDDITIVGAGTDPTTFTVAGAAFGATDTFVVYTNINRNSYGAGDVEDETPRTTLADDDPAVALLGTIDADTSNIATSVQTLDNVVGTTDSEAPTQVAMVGGLYEDTLTEVEDGDIAAISTDPFRRVETANQDRATGTGLVTDPDPLAAKSGKVTLLDVVLDNDPTSATSTPFFIGDKNKFTGFLRSTIDWTDSDPDVSVTYTFRAGPAADDLYDCDVVVVGSGTDDPVSSITHTPDADTDTEIEDSFYLPFGYCAEYFEITATAANSDANDTVTVDAKGCWKKG